MKLAKNHPAILKLGRNLIVGETYVLSGILYEVIDFNSKIYEFKMVNPLIKPAGRVARSIALTI